MRTEAKIFLSGIVFIPLGIVYGFLTEWTEWVGFLAIPLVGIMAHLHRRVPVQALQGHRAAPRGPGER
jgi:hypothetical protein